MQNLINKYHSRKELNELLLNVVQQVEVDIPIIKQLLEAGADPNYTDDFDGCILDNLYPHYNPPKKIEALKILLQHGANPNFRITSNVNHEGCLLHCITNDGKEYIKLSGQINSGDYAKYLKEIQELLLEHGAMPSVKLVNNKSFPVFDRGGYYSPSLVTNIFFTHMLSTGRSPYHLRQFIRDSNRPQKTGTKRQRKRISPAIEYLFGQDLVWNYHRFGTSSTILPDGSVIHIGGEHEDYYDEDFCIFNDVVKIDPKGKMELYFYNEKDFPPTDFHSATLYNDRIIIIGGLGYKGQRNDGTTKVFELDLNDFFISEWETEGKNPGCIYNHTALADLDNDRIFVLGGSSTTEKELQGVYCLHLLEGRWEKVD